MFIVVQIRKVQNRDRPILFSSAPKVGMD